MCRLTALIFILFFVSNNAFDFHESSFWDNEYPKRFFDVPTIEEQTNYAFHNVQHDNSVPFRQLFQKNRQIDSVIIPFDDDPQGKLGIKEQINILIPNKTDQEKVLEIVDSKDKSLMEKIGDLTKTLANTSKSSGLEQSELLHELVSDERARENVMYELKDSLNSEYKTIADKLVGVQKNATLSENEKLEIQEKVLKNIAEKAKEAFKSFEAFFQRSRRERRQLSNEPEVWNYRPAIYAKPGSENFPPNPIPLIPTAPPATNGNFADMLTKNRFLMPTPLEVRPESYPPRGFFPQEPTRPPNFEFYPSGFEPPKITTPPPPPSFGTDLSESIHTMSRAFEDRNQLFQKGKELLNREQQMLETAKTRVWNDGSQFIQRTQQTIGRTFENNPFLNNVPNIDNPIPRIQTGNVGAGLPIKQSAIGRFDTHIDRYDTTGNEKTINRIVLPDNFMQTATSNGAIVPSTYVEPVAVLEQDYRYIPRPGRPSPFGSNTGFPSNHIVGSFGPTFGPLPVLGPIPTTAAPITLGQDEARKIVQNGGFYPVIEGANTRFGPQTGPIGTHGSDGGFYSSAAAAKAGKSVNTRILTSETVSKAQNEPNSVVLTKSGPSDSLEFERAPATTTTTRAPEVTPYTTYPDYRQILFPVPLNQAKADPRPASGTVRRQDMFGGGTNEYREDNGRLAEYVEKDINNQKQWPSSLDVDNKRMEGYIDPAVKYGPVVTLENQPKPPYDGTSRASRPQGYMEGDDLSTSDIVGGIPGGQSNWEFTTPLPWNQQTTTIVAVPKIDIDSRLPFPANQNAKPGNKEIVWNRLAETAMKPPEEGQIRPYFGPEEITRSRYINVNPPPNNVRNGDGIRNKFLKIDLPNTSTIS